MRKIILLGFLFISYFLVGQPDYKGIDSLEQLLATNLADTTRMDILSAVGKKTAKLDFNKSENYINEYLELAEQTKDINRMVEAKFTLSSFYQLYGKLDTSAIIAREGLKLIEESGHENLRNLEAKLLVNVGNAVNERGNIYQALEYYELGAKKAEGEYEQMFIRYNIAEIYYGLGDHSTAVEIFTEIINFAKRTDDLYLESTCISSMAELYANLGADKKALSYYQEAIELMTYYGGPGEHGKMVNLASIADIYYKTDVPKAIVEYKSLLDKSIALKSEDLVIMNLESLTRAYWKSDDTEKALEYANRYHQITKNYPLDDSRKNKALYYLAGIYNSKNDYQKALMYARQAIKGYDLLGEKKEEIYLDVLFEWAHALQFTGNSTEAWNALTLRDSLLAEINMETQKSALAGAEVKYRLQEKEFAFQKTEKENELKITEAKSRQNILLGLLGGLGLFFLFGSFAYLRVQSANKTIESQSKAISQSLQEKESLLKEIHHRVKNNLQIISNLMAKQARKTTDSTVKKMMKEGQDRVQSMALIHQNLYQSEQLSNIGIKAYLEELTQNIAKTQKISGKEVAIVLDTDDSKLDIDTAIPIGLILNELITNAYKYAFPERDAGEIKISFQKTTEKGFQLQVNDNGIGISNDFNIDKAKSLGLNLVRGLVEQLDGTMKLVGSNQGTQFELVF